MSDSKRREHICFTGYVQGGRVSLVNYGVTGWVRNEYLFHLSERLIRLSSS